MMWTWLAAAAVLQGCQALESKHPDNKGVKCPNTPHYVPIEGHDALHPEPLERWSNEKNAKGVMVVVFGLKEELSGNFTPYARVTDSLQRFGYNYLVMPAVDAREHRVNSDPRDLRYDCEKDGPNMVVSGAVITSHLTALQLGLDSGADYAVSLELDMVAEHSWEEHADLARYDLVTMHRHGHQRSMAGCQGVQPGTKNNFGAGALMATRTGLPKVKKCAKALAAVGNGIALPIDHLLNFFAEDGCSGLKTGPMKVGKSCLQPFFQPEDFESRAGAGHLVSQGLKKDLKRFRP